MKKLLVIALFLCMVPSSAFAAIAFDTSKNCLNGISSSPGYCTITLGASDTAICVGNAGAVSGSASVTNVQVGTSSGTSSATSMGGVQIPSDRFIDMWCLSNPPTGTVTIQVTFTGTYDASNATSYSGVGAINAAATNTAGSGTTFGITTTPLLNNAWTVSQVGNAARVPSAGSGTTLRAADSNSSSMGDSGALITPAAAYTMNWASSASAAWGSIIVALEPTTAVAASPSVYSYAFWW